MLMACKNRILVNIDKGGSYIKQILPIIKECGVEKQVIIKGKYPVDKVKEEYGNAKGMLYMPIINLWKSESVASVDGFIKEFSPIAFEVCFKTDDDPNLGILDTIYKSGSRIWINTLWDTLC